MKVCIFADERSIHARRWVTGLQSLGIHIDLITLIKDDKFDIGGISLGAKSKITYFAKIGALKKHIYKLNPDIFHSHHASSFGFLASFVSHPAKILSVWGYDVITFPYKNAMNRAMVKRALKCANYITATSECLKEAVLKLNGEIQNLDIIPFGVDIELFRYYERENSDELVIGIAKSLRPKYGIDILIKAFYELRKEYGNIRLKIAGKGDFETEYRNLAADLGLEDSVNFLGYVDHSKLPEFLSKTDIYAMPSIFEDESFGVAAIEASATGLPVVASSVGGVPEVIRNNITGFLVKKNNIGELVAALKKLIEDYELRKKMGKAGRELVENRYDWKDNLRSMANLYEKVLAKSER